MLPDSAPEVLTRWFCENARALPWREDNEPYHVLVSEVMLQQTRVETVKAYYPRFLECLPDFLALARCGDDVLFKLWEGLGYYRRAQNLRQAARQVEEDFGGIFPRRIEQIRTLRGVGDYTAGALASICFDLPEPAVDGNVLRVLTRFRADDRPVDDAGTRRSIRESLREDCRKTPVGARGVFTQALMELGAVVCVPNGAPRCEICPLCGSCEAFRGKTFDRYPVKREKPPRKTEDYTVYVLECSGRYAIRRRAQTGLLAGLWELPSLPGERDAQRAVSDARELGVRVTEMLSVRRRGHIFTHIEWHMTCVHLRCAECADGFVWVTPEEMLRRYALPTAFQKALPEGFFGAEGER